jgi:hypothetical protein
VKLPDDADDEQAITYLLDEEVNSGLLVEVLAEYVINRMHGHEPRQAAWHALSEWDCL